MSLAQKRLANKVVLITGASAGIGESTAREYAAVANGEIKLILTARRIEKLESLKSELEAKYQNIKVFVGFLDVTKFDKVSIFLENLPSDFKEIDILINNSGKALGLDPVGEILQQDVEEMFQTNVLGLINLTQLVLKGMKQRNRGDIVNLGSVAGRDGYPGGSIYCATKSALRAFTQSLRKELINTKIRVIEIDPGNVETEFSNVRFKGDVERAKKVYESTEPLIADDIADLIVYTTSRKENTVIAETLIFSTNQAGAYHIYRGPFN
ncbi:hypothetical protein PACTADRAFT_75356 [Pachysolen tannophilus NRRL Y-2460]|uniref:Uncharacterized protein n=1 Tax=Pachysolen tannophilus NRRL Y-2460 TaxID=669874 RepID=A0A1E4TWS6_PACTA|nr:hypothetical protein PACTADRAFT_75356 [Pachysolen tannophilus NRRL Y-2460]